MNIYQPYFYIIQEVNTKMYYAGCRYSKKCHPSELLNEKGYITSSKTVKRIIRENGIESFTIRKIRLFDNGKEAHEYEKRFLTKVNARQNRNFFNCHNNDYTFYDNKNKIAVKDKDGNTFQVDKDDPRYLSGEFVGITRGQKPGKNLVTGLTKNYCLSNPLWESGEIIGPNTGKSNYIDNNNKYYIVEKEVAKFMNLRPFAKFKIAVKDKDGNTFQVDKDDPRYLSGELVGVTKGQTAVYGKDGNIILVDKDDSRILSGDLIHINKFKIAVKDKDGNTFQVDKDDPRYLSGELVGVTKGKVVVKDRDGNCYYIDKDDPRYLSGELISILSGLVTVKDKDGNTFQVDKDDPRYLSGELKSIVKKGIFYTNGSKNLLISVNEEIPEGFWKGKTTSKLKCYTNGIDNRYLKENEEIPEGFKLGRFVKYEKKKWYTDGYKNIKVLLDSEPPKGFYPGKTHKK